MKSIKINIPDGMVIDEARSTFNEIVFKKAEHELVGCFEDLPETGVGYVHCNAQNKVVKSIPYTLSSNAKNVQRTKELSEAYLAHMQLERLVHQANDGWEADWSCFNEKHVIGFEANEIKIMRAYSSHYFLAFKSQAIADEFFELHRDLIETAKVLL